MEFQSRIYCAIHSNIHWTQQLRWLHRATVARASVKAETHDATNRGDKLPRLHCCCDQSLALSLSLRYVAQIQTSLNLCDRSQRRNSVAATMIFTCRTRRFVAATCRGDVSQQFVASCVSAFIFFDADFVFVVTPSSYLHEISNV